MRHLSIRVVLSTALFIGGLLAFARAAEPLVQVITTTNATVRVMAANITTGNNQRYEGPGIRIFQGLKPDIVAVQEFNYLSTSGALNTAAALREMIDTAFGTNFVYSRETGYSIPNGVISRWPITASGSWDDVQVPDRGFAWAQIDIPGNDDLYVVSVHFHSSGGSSSRTIQATNLRTLIRANFPPEAFVVVAGDLNTDSRNESAVGILKTFLSDAKVPVDRNGNPNTNLSRQKPYDYVLPSFAFATNHTSVVIGAQQFPGGLVFDSRTYVPIDDVWPALASDSMAVNMQHMAVVKDFLVHYTVTNLVTVPEPQLQMAGPNLLHWIGLSQLTYTVQTNAALIDWATAGTVTSQTADFWFTNAPSPEERRFFRVVYP